MNVRLLRGTFGSTQGWALQDFESCSTGDITDTPFTFVGEEDVNGLSMEPATFLQRATT